MAQILIESEALNSLKRMVEELERDAARYRWIRRSSAWNNEERMRLLSENSETFDYAIDAAMKHE